MRLASSGAWARGVESPALQDKPGLRGYSQCTDSEGRYHFDVVTPTTSVQVLEFEPDAHHVRCTLTFGSGNRPVLAPGDHDLGDLVLSAAGAVSGTVLDEQGRPLGRSFVWIGHGVNGVLHGTNPDNLGEFRIEHVPAGRYDLEVCSPTHGQQRRTGIAVVAGRTLPGFDFRLEVAESLHGVVHDQVGAPLPGVQVSAWSNHGVNSDTVITGADGGFDVRLRWNEPSSIMAMLEGHAPEASGARHPPGARGLEIRLNRMRAWSFLVVDARSKRPLEKFFAEVQFGEFYHDGGSFEARPHPGGRVTLALRPGFDTVFFAVPGRLGRTVTVDPESRPGTTVTVEL